MTVVQNVLRQPAAGVTPVGQKVVVRLATNGFTGSGQNEIMQTTTLYTGSGGLYSIDLVPQSQIDPVGTHYEVTHPDGEVLSFVVSDATGPLWLRNLLVTNPAVPSPVYAGIHSLTVDGTTIVNGGTTLDPSLHVGDLSGTYATKAGNNTLAGRQTLGSATPDGRIPFFSSYMQAKTDSGSQDHIAYGLQSVVAGDFTGDTAPDAGYVWGMEVFATTGSGATDGNGIVNLIGIEAEVAVQSSGGTIANVTGLNVSTSLFGAPAGATITNTRGIWLSGTMRQGGATGGSIGTAYQVYIEAPTVGTTKYGIYQTGTCNNYLAGGLWTGSITSISGSLALASDFSAAASITLNNAANGGHFVCNLGATTGQYLFRNSSGTNLFTISGTGGTGTVALTDGTNISAGTTTGAMIGTGPTQKLGLFGKTPVVQPSGTPIAATDLASVITLANSLRTNLLALGAVA